MSPTTPIRFSRGGSLTQSGSPVTASDPRRAVGQLLVVTGLWPTPDQPSAGIFVARRVGNEAIAVVAPRSYRGPMPIRYLGLAWRALTARGRFAGVEAHPLFPGGLIGLLAATVRRVPLVVVAHGSDVRVTAAENGFYRALARLVIRQADAVIANSAATASHVVALGGTPDVIAPGIDRASFRPSPRPSTRRVLYLGGSDANKGVAVARLHADTLAGPGLRTLSPDEVASEISAHDVVLIPSYAEGYGLVAAEAGAAGRWVVARRIAALAEIVEDGVTGTLVDDDVGFAHAIATVPDYDPFLVASRSNAPSVEDARSAVAAVWTRVLASRRAASA